MSPRKKMAQARITETPEQRERRLAKKRASEATARQRATAEQRETLLAKKRWSAARAREKETPEERQARQARRRAADAETRQKETPEQRQRRLALRRAADTKARQSETSEQRHFRLAMRRVADSEARQNESQEKRQARLAMRRLMDAKARQNETPEQRHLRLAKKRIGSLKSKQIQATENELSHLTRSNETHHSTPYWMPSQSAETPTSRVQESATFTGPTDKRVKTEMDNAEDKSTSWLAEQCFSMQGCASGAALKQEKPDEQCAHSRSHTSTTQKQIELVSEKAERPDKNSVCNYSAGHSEGDCSKGHSVNECWKGHPVDDYFSQTFSPGPQQGVLVKVESIEYFMDTSQHSSNTAVSNELQKM